MKSSAASLSCRSASSASSASWYGELPEMLRVPPAPAPCLCSASLQGSFSVSETCGHPRFIGLGCGVYPQREQRRQCDSDKTNALLSTTRHKRPRSPLSILRVLCWRCVRCIFFPRTAKSSLNELSHQARKV